MDRHIKNDWGAPGYQRPPGAPMSNPYPNGAPPYQRPARAPVSNPPVLLAQIMGGLYSGKLIFITGIPHKDARRVTVNLQCGNDVVAFHFDVRFDYINCRKVIVRCTKMAVWGPEERVLPGGYFPFQPDVPFEMIILVETNCFKVAVNDQHLLEYKHRFQPLKSIDTLRIEGDLRVTQVRFQE